jgi:aspartyl-tRNA(Asn)/glutamyl-tRNA(Gln) amidotransferase subunit C
MLAPNFGSDVLRSRKFGAIVAVGAMFAPNFGWGVPGSVGACPGRLGRARVGWGVGGWSGSSGSVVEAVPVAWGVVSDRITPEAVAKVAKLARLSLSDAELDQATHQLSDMLDHFADIDALDLDGVEPMTHPTPIANVMREDVEMDCLDRDEVLAEAPAAEDGRFRVPPIVGLED